MSEPLKSIVYRSGVARLPTRHGDFSAQTFRVAGDPEIEHLVLTVGDIADGEPVLVRIHSECLTGDVFGSRRCDCGAQLDAALTEIARVGRGVVLYLRGHEGRGIGLSHKLRAYQLQDAGLDTVDANLKLGFPVDMRDYGPALAILADLGVFALRLMTNNPDKLKHLDTPPFTLVERVSIQVPEDQESERYLATKRDRLGHWLD